MDIKIIDNITTRNYTKGNNRKIEYIVIHYVGAVSTAKNNSNYFKTTYRGASAHYFVDENDIYRVVADKDIAWHCGANFYKHLNCRNSNSIGIEMCCFNNNGKIDVSETVVNKTIELVKELMAKYNIPIENILRHYDVTGKNCPEPFVLDSARWVNFINKIKSQDIAKYAQGDAVEVDIPIAWTGASQGDNYLVDSNGYQFWIHKSIINSNSHIVARAVVCFVYSTNLYMLEIFDKQFNCKSDYITKKL